MPLFSSHAQSPRHWRWAVPLALVGAFVVFAKVMNTDPPTNTAQTSPDDPDLKPRSYKVTFDEAAQKIAALPLSTYGRSWKVAEQNHISHDEIQLIFFVPVIVFTDVLTVTLKRQGDATTQVNVESHSRIGKGDFGENRRHVRQILSAMDKAI